MDKEIIFSRQGRAGVITLNRPRALNALTHNMVRLIHPQLREWADNPKIERVIIEGTGEKAFCAGGDVRALYDLGKAQDRAFLEFYREEYRLNTFIKQFPKPYIALIDGIVMGGGVGISVHGSHRVVGGNVMFAMPETGIGLFPDVGGTHFLPRCPGEVGMYMGLTGARLNAGDCLYSGVATHSVASSDFAKLKRRLGEDKNVDTVLGDMASEPKAGKLPDSRKSIDLCFGAGSVEEIISRLDSLSGEAAEWGAKTKKIIQSKSPTSLRITYRQIHEGGRLDFEDCMRLEYRMVNRIFAADDFFEGTRALIIDKDQAPRWNPDSLSEVTQALEDEYFVGLGDNELDLSNLN